MPTRERILDATRALCAEDGFQALTMRKVASRVGVSAPAIYRHFGGKAELIGELVREARGAFEQTLDRALGGRTPRERFDLAGDAYLDFALEQPQAYELLFLTSNQLGLFRMPNSLDAWGREPPPSFQFCVDRVQECMDAGDFRPGDATAVALMVSSLAHGIVALHLAGRFGDDVDRLRSFYRQSLELALEGVRS